MDHKGSRNKCTAKCYSVFNASIAADTLLYCCSCSWNTTHEQLSNVLPINFTQSGTLSCFPNTTTTTSSSVQARCERCRMRIYSFWCLFPYRLRVSCAFHGLSRVATHYLLSLSLNYWRQNIPPLSSTSITFPGNPNTRGSAQDKFPNVNFSY
jgi:hypothetical protein